MSSATVSRQPSLDTWGRDDTTLSRVRPRRSDAFRLRYARRALQGAGPTGDLRAGGRTLSTLRILFVGHIHPYQTTVARGDAFRELDIPIEVVDERDTVGGSGPFVYRFTAWTHLTPPVFAFNRQILEGARRFEPNVVWIEKGT